MRPRYGLEVEATLGGEPNVPLAVKEALYRVGLEALNYAARHARASQVTLRLAATEGGIALEVADDGVGFDPAAAYPGHLGLRSMRERLERLGGTLAVDSAPGRGSRLRADVPVAR